MHQAPCSKGASKGFNFQNTTNFSPEPDLRNTQLCIKDGQAARSVMGQREVLTG